jgi:hypothetical protein
VDVQDIQKPLVGRFKAFGQNLHCQVAGLLGERATEGVLDLIQYAIAQLLSIHGFLLRFFGLAFLSARAARASVSPAPAGRERSVKLVV